MALTSSVYVLMHISRASENYFHRLVALICHRGALKRGSGLQIAKDLIFYKPPIPHPRVEGSPCDIKRVLSTWDASSSSTLVLRRR